MLRIDRRDNITLNAGDNGILDIEPCGCDYFECGDKVIFSCGEQKIETTEFVDGVAKIYIDDKTSPYDGTYCVYVEKRDGRKEQVKFGKYTRKGGC